VKLVQKLAFVRASVARFWAHPWASLALVMTLLAAPLAFGSQRDEAPLFLGLPAIASGDEPHYLVFLTSLVEDGDLDLGNNYRNVWEGGLAAGRLWQGGALDPHTVWRKQDGALVHWFQVFERDAAKWTRPNGHWEPRLAPGRTDADRPTVERPWNFPGLAILLTPLCVVARKTRWLEPLALFWSYLATIGSLFAARSLAGLFTTDRARTHQALFLAFLGTPLWHYGRSLFPEPFLTLGLTGAAALLLVGQRPLLAGLAGGVAIFVKPAIVVGLLPLGIWLLVKRRLAPAIRFSVGPLLGVGGILFLNARLYGSPSAFPAAYVPGDRLLGTLHLLFEADKGLLALSLPAVIGFCFLARDAARDGIALTLSACVVAMFVLNAGYGPWNGGFCYATRYLVPIMPVAGLGLIRALERGAGVLTVIGVPAVALGALAAIQYWRVFGQHPFPAWFGTYGW